MDPHDGDLAGVAASQARVEFALQNLATRIMMLQSDVSLVMDSIRSRGKEDSVRPARNGHLGVVRIHTSPEDFTRSSRAEQVALAREASDDEQPGRSPDVRKMTTSSSQMGARMGFQPSVVPDKLVTLTLPADWPKSLKMRWVLGESRSQQKRLSSQVAKENSLLNHGRWAALVQNAAHFQQEEHAEVAQDDPYPSTSVAALQEKRWFIRDPRSTTHVVYQIVSLCCLMYDLTMIPVMLAWDTRRGLFYIVTFLTASFWTVDVGISFTTAYDSEGELVVAPWAIAKRYFRTWLLFDLLVVAGTWASISIGFMGETIGSSWATLRFLKVGQLLRALNVFRTLKFLKVVDIFLEEISGQVGKVLVRLMTPFIGFVYLCHWIACLWFYIGKEAPTDTGLRWTEEDYQLNLMDEDNPWYEYLHGIHVSVAVVTLVTSHPWVNSAECMFSTFVLFAGLIAGSAFVSSLSAAMVEQQVHSRDKRMKLMQMQRYLQENSVNWVLGVIIQRQLEERLSAHEKLKDSEVEGVQILSESLRVELKFQICRARMLQHPLFRFWISVSDAVVKRFCMECMRFVNLRKHDELFMPGAAAEGAYLSSSGCLKYTQDPQSSPVDEVCATNVAPSAWLAEAALWAHWIHVGTVQAVQHSQVLMVRAVDIAEVMQRSATIVMVAQDYCRAFHRRLQAAKPPAASWPDDLTVPCTGWGELVAAMGKESQIAIGMRALRHDSRWHSQKLRKEVAEGRCVVMTGEDGKIQRVVSVVALKITNKDGQLLVRLAKEDDGGVVKPECQLPGVKQERGELTSETMGRLLEERLSPLARSARCSRVESEVDWQSSKEYGVLTKYLRHICHCELQEESCLEEFRVQLPGWEDHPSPVLHSGARQNVGGPFKLRRGGSLGTITTTTSQLGYDPMVSLSTLLSADTFRIEDHKGKSAYFTWLHEHVFEFFRQPSAEPVIAAWVAKVGENSMSQTRAPLVDLAIEEVSCEAQAEDEAKARALPPEAEAAPDEPPRLDDAAETPVRDAEPAHEAPAVVQASRGVFLGVGGGAMRGAATDGDSTHGSTLSEAVEGMEVN